jgi:hypothetical protein
VWCALVLALALQVSGLGHMLADALDSLAQLEHVDADCDDGKDCPPGCPDCHCVHMRSLVVMSAQAVPFEFATRIDFPLLYELRPKAPALDAVYRPPRA